MNNSTENLDDHTMNGDLFKVLINDEGQYSLWPAAKIAPSGWSETGCRGSKSECLDYVDKSWTDMRPMSLRKKMAN